MKYNFYRLLWGMIMLTACMQACKKGGEPTPDENPDGGDQTLVKTGVYRIVNLALDSNATSSGDAVSFYYNLEENKIVPASLRQTSKWDIVFYGIYNSSVYPNDGSTPGSPAYGGPGKAKLYLVVDRKRDALYYDTLNFKPHTLPIPVRLFQEAFDAVKTVPVDDSKFFGKDIGLDHFQGFYDGWGYYDFWGSLYPDNPKKAHVVYTMPRVIIVKTHRGKYAKLMIESIYKDNPEDPNRDNKPGFLTFRYAIQMDGSKNLDIK